jgi:FeS assembly SUF system regulator
MIRITKQTDYGIVLMTRLARGEGGGVENARDLAAATNLPLPTVSKILKALARGGLLASHRGVKGGYSLSREPAAISVEEIIRALEGPIAITECLDDSTEECGIEFCCPCRANWARINQAVSDALRAVPLSEMTAPITFPQPVKES